MLLSYCRRIVPLLLLPFALANDESLENMTPPQQIFYWPRAVVIYTLDSNVGCPSSPPCQKLLDAMEEFHLKTCIRFKQWTGEPHQVHFKLQENVCRSELGVQQDVSELEVLLGEHCMTRVDLVYHLSRILGLSELASAPDERKKTITLKKYHHWPTRKSYNEKNMQALSSIDIIRLSRLYGCVAGSEPTMEYPQDLLCDFSSNMCGLSSTGQLQWELHPLGGVVQAVKEEGGEELSGTLVSPVMHRRNLIAPGNGTGCLSFWYMTQGYAFYELQVRLRILDRATQVRGVNQAPVISVWESGEMTMPYPSDKNIYTYVANNIPVTRHFKVEIEFRASWGMIALDDLHVVYRPCVELSPPPED